MTIQTQPPFGSAAYQQWHNDYEGRKPARVAPKQIGSLNEALDCIGRLSLRLRYWENRERRLINMDLTRKTPFQLEARRNQLFEVSRGIEHTKQQIIDVVKYNLPLWPVPQP